jgi:hypothetical protein
MRTNENLLHAWMLAVPHPGATGHLGACFKAISKAGIPMAAEIGMIHHDPT